MDTPWTVMTTRKPVVLTEYVNGDGVDGWMGSAVGSARGN